MMTTVLTQACVMSVDIENRDADDEVLKSYV
jgi:hypothetical protein